MQSKTKLHIGFCTAVPFCLDPRLPEHGLLANCGAGTSLLAINPDGEIRICNQSNISYGNILKRNILDIWKDKSLNEFRDKSWVTPPCKNCFLFDVCLAGCKVDNSQRGNYCVDYAVRGYKKSPVNNILWDKSTKKFNDSQKNILAKINFNPNDLVQSDRFTKLNLIHKDKLLVTRHQTIAIDPDCIELLKMIIHKNHQVKDILLKAKNSNISLKSAKYMLKQLIFARAIFINVTPI